MKIFISWSGAQSREIAEALGPWMKKVVQSVDYWMSADMERGVKWLEVISKRLDEHSFGILCVTPGNKAQPWLNFEAGALSKQLADTGRLIPYLLDFRSPSDLDDPLGQFNASLADEDGTWDLIKTVNNHADHKLDEPALRETFDMFWPQLRRKLTVIQGHVTGPQPERRSLEDKVDDLLELVRTLWRAQPSAWSHSSLAGDPALLEAKATLAKAEEMLTRATGYRLLPSMNDLVDRELIAAGLDPHAACVGCLSSDEYVLVTDGVSSLDALTIIAAMRRQFPGLRILGPAHGPIRRALNEPLTGVDD